MLKIRPVRGNSVSSYSTRNQDDTCLCSWENGTLVLTVTVKHGLEENIPDGSPPVLSVLDEQISKCQVRWVSWRPSSRFVLRRTWNRGSIVFLSWEWSLPPYRLRFCSQCTG
jgi:hypothetical protein